MTLLPFDALYELASLFTESMKKYPARNWERGLSWSETQDSLLRHLTEWTKRDDVDKESGFHHDVHILWNAIVLVTMRLRGIGKDDRMSEPSSVSDPISDGLSSTVHPVEGDSSNPVAPVTAGDKPAIPILTADEANVMFPYYNRPKTGNGSCSIIDPVTSKVIAYVLDP